MIISEVLSSIDNIDSITQETEMNVCFAIAESYDKMLMIQENYYGEDIQNFSIFQEGKIMDDVKEQGKGMSTIMKILSFIPRLVKSIIKAITGKLGTNSQLINKAKSASKNEKKMNKATKIAILSAVGLIATTAGVIIGKNKKKQKASNEEEKPNSVEEIDSKAATTEEKQEKKNEDKIDEAIEKKVDEFKKLENQRKEKINDIQKTNEQIKTTSEKIKNDKLKEYAIECAKYLNVDEIKMTYDAEKDEVCFNSRIIYMMCMLLMNTSYILYWFGDIFDQIINNEEKFKGSIKQSINNSNDNANTIEETRNSALIRDSVIYYNIDEFIKEINELNKDCNNFNDKLKKYEEIRAKVTDEDIKRMAEKHTEINDMLNKINSVLLIYMKQITNFSELLNMFLKQYATVFSDKMSVMEINPTHIKIYPERVI